MYFVVLPQMRDGKTVEQIAYCEIVTEFGAAELRGQTLAERTRRLIAIAHPDFREELQRASHIIQQRGF